MNVTPGFIANPLIAQQSPLYQSQTSIQTLYDPQQVLAMQSQWNNNSGSSSNNNNSVYSSYQLPLHMSQYYNVFPEVPSTRTSWTFPNGCVTSNIVRFTGTPTPTYPVGSVFNLDNKVNGPLPTKRKSLVPENEEIQPNKMFITEEKMAARMSGMHISNDFISHNTRNFSQSTADKNMDEELSEYEQTSQPQLVICDELKNLSRDIDSIVPEPLIPMDKPTTALVLWRPPMSYLNVIKIPPEEKYPQRSSVIITDITDRPDLDNNNINSVNLNALDNSIVEQPPDDFEIMES